MYRLSPGGIACGRIPRMSSTAVVLAINNQSARTVLVSARVRWQADSGNELRRQVALMPVAVNNKEQAWRPFGDREIPVINFVSVGLV